MKPYDGRYSAAALVAPSFCRILEAIFERRARCQVLSSRRRHETPRGSGETSRRTSVDGIAGRAKPNQSSSRKWRNGRRTSLRGMKLASPYIPHKKPTNSLLTDSCSHLSGAVSVVCCEVSCEVQPRFQSFVGAVRVPHCIRRSGSAHTPGQAPINAHRSRPPAAVKAARRAP